MFCADPPFRLGARGASQLPELAKRGGGKPLAAASLEEVEKEIADAQRFGARMIRYGEAGYPSLLHMIPDPPPVITVMGNSALWEKQAVAIVGARNASANGCAMAQKLAAALGGGGGYRGVGPGARHRHVRA